MRIDFEVQTEYGLFRDAITLPDDYPVTDAEIEAIKKQRVDEWLSHVTAIPQEEPVPEDHVVIDGVMYKKVQ